MASHWGAIAMSADWRLVVAKHRSDRPGVHRPGKRSWVASSTSAQSRCDSVVWASSATGSVNCGSVVDLGDRLDPVDGVGCDRHGADRLLVALVADVDDPVALARPHPHLVVDLGHQRAHRVDHVAALGPGRRDHLGSRAVGRQHDRRAVGHVGDVVDEDHAQRLEAIDHHLVVDDLVVAVHGRLEGPHHPRQRLDRHLHAGAEAARRRQEHLVDLARAGDVHDSRLPTPAPGTGPAPGILDPHVCPSGRRCRARLAGRASGHQRGRRGRGAERQGAPRRDRVAAAGRRGRPGGRAPPGRPRRHDRGGQARRRGARARRCSSALFDQVRTCDNHCAFCFIYQLPPGMRSSLYLKDDDYRLSFLYGNFTTLTRFTEADLERVVTEGLSPLHVSIHATDPDIRSEMLRNRRGATSLRWLRALLDHGVAVHGQVVCCPGINDGAVLDDTLCGVLDRYPELASLCVVPLGVSRFNHEPTMRPHTRAEADAVVDVRRALAGHLPPRARATPGLRRRRVLPPGRPALPRAGHLRGLPDARGRRRDGPHLRAGVPRSGHDADRRAERLLRLGRRRPGRGLPGAPQPPAPSR